MIFPYSCDAGRWAWDRAMKYLRETNPVAHAGIADLTPACLRHTFASNLLNNGVNIRQLQKLMGHSSISTTELYLRQSRLPLDELAMAAGTLGLVARDAPPVESVHVQAMRLLADAKRDGRTPEEVLAEVLADGVE